MGVWGAISGDLEPFSPSLSKIGVFLGKTEKSIFSCFWFGNWFNDLAWEKYSYSARFGPIQSNVYY